MATDRKSYTVGYRRPPRHTQFARGCSGNPQGRPKGVKNFATEIQEELAARIPIAENGKRKKISKRKAVAKQLVNRAASGDHKAMALVLNETRTQEALKPAEFGKWSEDDLLFREELKKLSDQELSDLYRREIGSNYNSRR